ncbi:MAG: hypothetical protein JHD02_04645 [Thermoleophilaceae bacterium]|nr:hypothetical protein [Thermoleophilaceae bacterium]
MTTDPDNTPVEPENAAESLPEERSKRFDPFTNEGDMFKIVLGVGAGVLVIALLAVIVGAIF